MTTGWLPCAHIQMALGFIGLSAGGHFEVSEIAGSLGPALVILSSLVVLTYSGCLIAVMVLGPYFIPFFAALEQSQRLAAALLIACLSVARSPSSAIAIISELNAKGPFTTVVLAVTVMMDVVVVVLFSVTLMLATVLDDPTEFGARPDGSSPFFAIAKKVFGDFVSKVSALAQRLQRLHLLSS